MYARVINYRRITDIIEFLNDIVQTLNNILWGNLLIIPLIVLGVYFTVGTDFVQFTYFKEMLSLLGDGIGKLEPKSGSISSFQAFCISTASRVGTSNIAV
ncbi:alanine:cation symporter family protein [Cellulosilyticum ruminicola]|uniref:alanine:cation symporter family protein n=1 Tax=Cellulosilyticum ruminicola TaxID=425254 RepID=UPI0006D10DB3|nr:sodium:alanine symporter family protein [Cellulosilyticum ruminicola]